MFLNFFYLLKEQGIPVSLQEYLNLLEATQTGLANNNVDDFYSLCKITLIKHEQHFDKFDILFGAYFKGIEKVELDDPLKSMFNEEWIRKNFNRVFTEEEKKMIEAMGGLDKLMERLKELMEEQKERHEGGNKWIGTGGKSPFGNSGYNPEGVRIGGESTHKRAVKVWEKREYQNLDSDVELNTRNTKLALKKLRLWAREGAEEELDLDNTIRKTAANGGMLNIQMVPEKKNHVKVLLFFDVGGSMDPYIELCSELFSAAHAEFKHLEYFYFHNCIYEGVWKDNALRWGHQTPTMDILNKFNSTYKVIIIGDAYMSPYEIVYAGGSVDFNNEEPGSVWIKRITDHFPNCVWLNPMEQVFWEDSQSIRIIHDLMDKRMFPLTLEGIQKAMKNLMTRKL
jgi:uncharacterized protein with von Willebrand factor type A (vWA) domain